MSEYSAYGQASMDEFLCRGNLRALQKISREQIDEAIKGACDFFGIPMPVFTQDLSNYQFGATMFLNVDPTSFGDDILYYNMQELAQLHIGSRDAFSLIMTHECAHRVLQGIVFPGPYHGSWQNELAADFLMGTRAGFAGMTAIKHVIEGLAVTQASKSHPSGYLRAEFIKQGVMVAMRLKMQKAHVPIKKLLAEYQKYYQIKLPIIRKEEENIYSADELA